MAKKVFPDGTEIVPFYVRTIRSGLVRGPWAP